MPASARTAADDAAQLAEALDRANAIGQAAGGVCGWVARRLVGAWPAPLDATKETPPVPPVIAFMVERPRGRLRPVHIEGVPPEEWDRIPIARVGFGEIDRLGPSVFERTTPGDPFLSFFEAIAPGTKSVTVVPVEDEGRAWGALAVATPPEAAVEGARAALQRASVGLARWIRLRGKNRTIVEEARRGVMPHQPFVEHVESLIARAPKMGLVAYAVGEPRNAANPEAKRAAAQQALRAVLAATRVTDTTSVVASDVVVVAVDQCDEPLLRRIGERLRAAVLRQHPNAPPAGIGCALPGADPEKKPKAHELIERAVTEARRAAG
ncbi:MAG TPA: hypothetical protein VKE69_08890 [Planctomycetota bacterium]|nr:hypothetical protein [Planctomycetota bacterium]